MYNFSIKSVAQNAAARRLAVANLGRAIALRPAAACCHTYARLENVNRCKRNTRHFASKPREQIAAENKLKKPPLATRIKEELLHYAQGSKLLWLETRLSVGYLARLARGEKLTRREHLQLRRTVADMFRLVPFLVIVAVPFAELALPVLLKIFPNMLPSTFEKNFETEEKRRRLLRLRVELARFLQDTAPASSSSDTNVTLVLPNDHASMKNDEFTQFFCNLRETQKLPSTESLVRIAARFDDEATLELLSRSQLRLMCKYMGINAFGTDPFLRYLLRSRMRRLRSDDMMIHAEGGAKSLSTVELQRACTERGLAANDATLADETRLREELQLWIDWHLQHKVPASILILARAFSTPTIECAESTGGALFAAGTPATASALAETLKSLPETLVSDAEFKHSGAPASLESYQKRISLIQKEERVIKEEREKEIELSRALPASVTLNLENSDAKSLASTTTAECLNKSSAEPAISVAHVRELGEAIKVLASASAVQNEKKELAQLAAGKNERLPMEDDALVSSAVRPEGLTENEKFSAETLMKSPNAVERLLRKVQKDLDDYERDVGSRTNLIRAASDGSVSAEDLARALAAVRSEPQSNVVQRIVRLLDADGDGRVGLSELLAYVNQLEEQEGHGVVINDQGNTSLSAGTLVFQAPAQSQEPSSSTGK